MSSEKSTWASLKRIVGDRWHATRIEDRLQSGVPDVSWGARGVQGWIELKYVPKPPVRLGTPFRIGLRPEQAVWLQQRGRVGNYCWVLARVQNLQWLLFDWREARILLNPQGYHGMCSLATKNWVAGLDPEEFLDTITTRTVDR